MEQTTSGFSDNERRFHQAIQVLFEQWKVGKDAENEECAPDWKPNAQTQKCNTYSITHA